MTLLEQWDQCLADSSICPDNNEIRRALAIAQAVEESAALRGYSVDGKWLMRRIDELMEGK